ncbi:hypothetical protein BGZ74_003946, partial [Mortierella antarctica]
MGVLCGVPPGSVEKTGFTGYSKLFCDSIIFWGLYNTKRKKSKGKAVKKYITELRGTFKESEVKVDSIKQAYSGRLDEDSEYFSKRTLKSHRKEFD